MSYEDDEIDSALLAYPFPLPVFDRSSVYPHCLCQNYPQPDMEGTTLITIVKGDTLWDLATEHLKDPLKWSDSNNTTIFPILTLSFPTR